MKNDFYNGWDSKAYLKLTKLCDNSDRKRLDATHAEMMENWNYFYGFFAVEYLNVIKAFGGHGRKHSIKYYEEYDPINVKTDEAFLHHRWQYHTWKAFTHLVRGCFGSGIDKDSGHHHLTLATLRLYMALNRSNVTH